MTPGSFMRGVLSIDRRWQVVAFVSPDRSSAARAAHREQARSYKEMASLTDWAIVGNIATMDIRTGEPFDTAKLFSAEHLRKA